MEEQKQEQKEETYLLPLTQEETVMVMRALDEYLEDNPNSTSTAERLHRKAELLNNCITAEKELFKARTELLEYSGWDYYDND